MAEIVTLSKLLNVRQNEKKTAEKFYQKSMDIFEKAATQLYTLLRKKETAEESYEGALQNATSIDKIRDQAVYIEQLNKQIVGLQEEVQQARDEMDAKHEQLTNAHVEVKKFEKIIEHRNAENAAVLKKQEQETMDEISVQQYLNRKTGELNGRG